MVTKLLSMISLSFVLGNIPMNADPSVYLTSADPVTGVGQFGTIDLTTGAYQQIGPIEPDGYFGLAPGPNGSLVSLTYAGNLDAINPATGIPTRTGPTGLGNCVIPARSCGPNSAFTLGSLAGKIYATDFQNNLYVVNPVTGAATLLSAHSGIPASPFVLGSLNPDGTINFADEAIWSAGGKLYATFDALAFDLNSFTVASVKVAPELYQIDPLTGVATAIGATDLGIGAVLDVNGTSYEFNDLTDQIGTLNLANGKTTFVSDFDPSAGVIQGTFATPEPTSFALFATGILATLVIIRRRRVLN